MEKAVNALTELAYYGLVRTLETRGVPILVFDEDDDWNTAEIIVGEDVKGFLCQLRILQMTDESIRVNL